MPSNPLRSLRCDPVVVCVQHMRMFRLTSKFSKLKAHRYLIRAVNTLLFLIVHFSTFTVFEAIISTSQRSRGLVIAFPDVVINSAVFQVQTVSVGSYGECGRLKLSFEIWVLFKKEKKTEAELSVLSRQESVESNCNIH